MKYLGVPGTIHHSVFSSTYSIIQFYLVFLLAAQQLSSSIMGSDQSSLTTSQNNDVDKANNNNNSIITPESTTSISTAATTTTTTTKSSNSNESMKKTIPNNLTGYTLVEYKCRKKRARYDQCYRTKHSAFVVGSKVLISNKNTTQGSESGELEEASCEELFDAYKDCILKGMLKDRKGRGLPPPRAESALGDFDDEEDDR